jgi:hypothetical protein
MSFATTLPLQKNSAPTFSDIVSIFVSFAETIPPHITISAPTYSNEVFELNIISDDLFFTREFQIPYTRERNGSFSYNNAEHNIYVNEETPIELLEAIKDEYAFSWNYYVEKDDSELTPDAQQYKRWLKNNITKG